MILTLIVITQVLVIVTLILYEDRATRVRRRFLESTSPEKFADLVHLSVTSSSSMLSFSGVIFSIWAAFALVAPLEIKEVYGESILAVLATCSVSILSYAASMYLYHLAHYIEFKRGEEKIERQSRMELYVKGTTFFVIGTAFFLLTFLFSFLIVSLTLVPMITQCLTIMFLFLVPFTIVGLITLWRLRPILKMLSKVT